WAGGVESNFFDQEVHMRGGLEKTSVLLIFLVFAASGLLAESIKNWPAPATWSPAKSHGVSPMDVTNPLPFIGLAPCRIVDTRGNGAPIQGGIFTGGSDVRNYILAGICGIPASARAVSLNFTVTGPGQTTPGFLLAWPSDGPVPAVSILNWDHVPAQIANAAVVPTSSTVSITVNVSAPTHVIVDVNGYYDNSGLITGVTAGTGLAGGGTSGTVSLGIAAGGVTSTQLASASVTSAKIAANAVTAGAIASGQVAKNVNGVTDSVTVAGSGAVTVNTVGSTITIGGGGAGTPSGSFILGNPGDTTLTGAGYT